MVAITANQGVFFDRSNKLEQQKTRQFYYKYMKLSVRAMDFKYDGFYFLVCITGLLGHNLIYCVLVGGVSGWGLIKRHFKPFKIINLMFF